MSNQDFDYHQIVIGSGFGGSVSALRLSEKGNRVLILEKGFFSISFFIDTASAFLVMLESAISTSG